MSTMTVAICARRAEGIIGRCLESIQRQTCPPEEILVAVDDLSDPTADVARSYGVRVIESRARGLYEARNVVLNSCRTDYLGFVDADCIMTPKWVELAKTVLDSKPDVAGGTGRHPPTGERTFASWLHHMWFVVETCKTGETDGVIGGNSFFRVSALRAVNGWLPLSGHSAAEDVYISLALRKKGYKLWFESDMQVEHHYETRLRGLWRKAVMMGKDIVVMMRAAGWREGLWWYTLLIPVMALMLFLGFFLVFFSAFFGGVFIGFPLLLSLLFLTVKFGSFRTALPRWAARWILIWPYSWGILKGLFAPLPLKVRS